MLLREVSYARPETIEEALSLLAEHDGARALAGGQTLVNVMKQRAASPDVLVDLAKLGELREIAVSGQTLEIGAMATLTSIVRSSEVEVSRPILAEVAATVADVQVRNRGTLGGNICVNDPTNHFPPLLVALDATMTIRNAGGERTVPAEEFFVGVFETAVGEGDLLTRISVPAGGGDGMSGVTLGVHGTYVANAAASVVDGAWRIALGCVAAVPVRATAVEERLVSGETDEAVRADGGRRARLDARPAVGRARVRRLPPQPRGDLRRPRRRASSRASEGVSVSAEPTTSQRITVTVNDEQIEYDVPTRRLLVHFLRDDLDLTGTHVGCDTGSCGACTVHLDGVAVKSCAVLAVQADGATVTTVEGLAGEELSPLQQSFREHHALQCGYCTPGMLMSASALLEENPSPSEDEVKVALQGNICRCTGYWNIVEAVVAAGKASA